MAETFPRCRTIALMNQKGGVGKTTTTVNLAAAIARAGRPTLVVDLDPQAHATLHLGVDPDALRPEDGEEGADGPQGSVYDLYVDPDAEAGGIMREVRENLWLIPAETDLAAAETELAGEADRNERLKRALARVSDRFEYVFLDCPPSLGLLTVGALVAAREVFVPMQAHFLAMQGMSKLLETVSLVSAEVNPRLRVTGVILTMHDGALSHSKEVVAELESFFAEARQQESAWKAARVLAPAVRRNIKLAECPSFGQTIFDYAPGCPGAADYEALGQKMIAEWDAVKAKAAGSREQAAGKGKTKARPEIVVKGGAKSEAAVKE